MLCPTMVNCANNRVPPCKKNTELTLWHAQGQADSGANADARYRQPADSDHGDQP